MMMKQYKAKTLTTGISDKKDGYIDLTDEMLEETYDKIEKVLKNIQKDKDVCHAESAC